MMHYLKIGARATIAVGIFLTSAAQAQEFQDVQRLSNTVLFAAEDVAAQKREAEARRIEALDQRSQEQDLLLKKQNASLQRLGGELQAVRDERQLIELAAGFDASLAAGQWSSARSFLAEAISADLGGSGDALASVTPSDSFISGLANSSVRITVLPRFNQQVRIDADRGILTANGLPWRSTARSASPLSERVGKYEYRFTRTSTGWKIDGLAFTGDETHARQAR